MEAHFAPHGGHAETVAIAADARDDAGDELLGFRVAGFAEAERVHRGDGARAHGEDVAQDASHAGGGPLVGLNIRGVVVAFHLEDDGLAVADIHDARVFAGAADHLRALGGQGAQPFLGGFIRAMLVPHGGENAKLGEGWFAANDLEQIGIFVRA